MKKSKSLTVFLLLFLLTVVLFAACSNEPASVNEDNRSIILENDYTNKARNELLIEDIEYFRTQLPEKHKNPFHNISKEKFNNSVDNLISKVDELTNKQVFVELNKIIDSIGDAHTVTNYWDGFSYPLKFYCFNDGIYVIDADKSLGEILYAKVNKINGVDINIITEELRALISYENEYWFKERLPAYLSSPVFMYGLGIISDEEKTTFEFETVNKEIIKKEINICSYGENPDYINLGNGNINVYLFNREKEDYYWYKYLEEDKMVYFKYNVCNVTKGNLFVNFNYRMFNSIKNHDIEKFIIDLRHNSGGNSEVINPFLKSIADLASSNPEMKIYVITGRATFSSGVMAVLDINNKVDTTLIGECTGGSPNSYGDVGIFELLNLKIPIQYSKKYFQLTNDNSVTITPDIIIEPTIKDFIENKDFVMDYILKEEKPYVL